MEVRILPNNESYQRMTTGELRKAFLLERLFVPGAVSMVYCDADRAIVGGAIPNAGPLTLTASKKEMAAEFFTERREVCVANIGTAGMIKVDGKEYRLQWGDMLYIGRGTRSIELCSVHHDDPPAFYFVSYPAHTAYPVTLAPFASAEKTVLGTPEGANRRTIHKHVHTGGVRSCQLVMGHTVLESGSVWNTMPPHTHLRRMEIYLYFGLDPDAVAVHLMGQPDGTRNLIVRNREAVISPSWSVHCGAATGRYSFIWAMGGENQEFTDMDPVAMNDIF